MTTAEGAWSGPRHADLFGDERRLLATRLRAGLGITLAALLLFATADLFHRPANLTLLLTIKAGLALIVASAALWLRRTMSVTALTAIAVVVVTLTYLTSAVSGVLTSEIASTPVLLVVFSIAAAAALPWGIGAQLATVVVALAATAATAVAVTGGTAVLVTYPAIAIMIALSGSVYVAWEHDRHRAARGRLASLLDGQAEVLGMVALRSPLADVLDLLCHVVERHGDGLLCSVLLLDGDRLRHAAAPSIPATYSAGVDGIEIGQAVGSCGTAAYLRKRVVVRDIATDPLWDAFRDAALTHGLRACWSAPILATDGRCLGTFAMYYREPREPDDDAWPVIDLATHLAGIAIERRRTEDALLESQRQLEEESHVAGALVQVGHVVNSTLQTREILTRLCSLTTELVGCDCSDTILPQGEGETWMPVSAHGYSDDDWESLRVLEIAGTALAPLVTALEQHGLMQFNTEQVTDPVTAGLLRRYGITVSMYVALRRGDAVIGILSCGYRGHAERFTPVQQRVARGIAQLASLALENARLVEELRAANQLKNEFVSTMSHELRTPLSVILGYTDMLEEDLPPTEQERTLAKIRRSGVELLEMIEATLNLSRLEAGQDPPSFEILPIGALFDELAGEFAALDRPRTTLLRWEASADVTLVTDRRKLKIVLKNLVGNALKFTPAGEVAITCRSTSERCTIVVRDTGVGIAPHDLPVIFEMFRQVDSSDSRSYSGVGLGLYIVRRLVDQLGGHVEVESQVGRGTTFTVQLPTRDTVALAPATGHGA